MNYKVSQINYFVKQILSSEEILYNISIEGEISNFKSHNSGHMFFTLKDEISTLKCVMFKNDAQRIEFCPNDGIFVCVRGDIRVYEKDGVYQLYGHKMEKGGIGDFKKRVDDLKQKLEKEGLFDRSFKKPIPAYPNVIGIVTGVNSAALTDIINIIERRYPIAKLKLFPSLVQGKDAASDLCNAINKASKSNLDILIIGRGGGQVEDLEPFNDEKVVRMITKLSFPVISAVGHEKDTSLIDLVADIRASTPSAAAELAVPEKEELERTLELMSRVLYNNISTKIMQKEREYINLSQRLSKLSILYQLKKEEVKINEKRIRINTIISRKQNQRDKIIEIKELFLQSRNPYDILKRGYAAVYDKNGKIINSITGISKGSTLKIQLWDGKLKTIVDKIEVK